jgi:glycosyltransferase involved in cell wall biosynthesis
VIASNIGNTAATVLAESAGLVYAPGDPLGLSVALQKFANQPGDARQMRQNARNYYLATHTPEKNYERLMEIYAQASHITERAGIHEIDNDHVVADRPA